MSQTELRNADIDAALTEAKEAYITRNQKSFSRFVEATAVMPGGNTRTVLHYAPFPIGIARGEGCRLWDLDGAEYIDFLGEYTAGIYGHSHPKIRAAVDRALDAGINFGGTNLTEAKFARAVCDRFGLERVRFTNSGTEANLLAISVGRIFTKRPNVMVFDGGYHGAVFGFAGGGSPINAPFETRKWSGLFISRLLPLVMRYVRSASGVLNATIVVCVSVSFRTHRANTTAAAAVASLCRNTRACPSCDPYASSE